MAYAPEEQAALLRQAVEANDGYSYIFKTMGNCSHNLLLLACRTIVDSRVGHRIEYIGQYISERDDNNHDQQKNQRQRVIHRKIAHARAGRWVLDERGACQATPKGTEKHPPQSLIPSRPLASGTPRLMILPGPVSPLYSHPSTGHPDRRPEHLASGPSLRLKWGGR